MEFLVQIQVDLPPDMPAHERDSLLAEEARRGRELKLDGTIVRIWRIPGRLANAAIWSAPHPTALHEALSSLPVFPYTDIRVTALATHPLEASPSSQQ